MLIPKIDDVKRGKLRKMCCSSDCKGSLDLYSFCHIPILQVQKLMQENASLRAQVSQAESRKEELEHFVHLQSSMNDVSF